MTDFERQTDPEVGPFSGPKPICKKPKIALDEVGPENGPFVATSGQLYSRLP